MSKQTRYQTLPIFFLLLFSACNDPADSADPLTDSGSGDDDSGADSGPPPDAGVDAGGEIQEFPIEDITVEWFPCSLHEGYDDGLAECSATKMPFRWGIDDARTFTVYAKRLKSTATETDGQLWLLEGGPGGSGTHGNIPVLMQQFQMEYPELDLYTLDARGTGHSDFLSCPTDESGEQECTLASTFEEMTFCASFLAAEHGEDLEAFSSTNAAVDLAAYIHATREDGKKTLIWGNSWGTYWQQRYLLLFPDQADGLVLEANAPPDYSFVLQPAGWDKMLRRVLELCTEDTLCSSKLTDPIATLEQLKEKLATGHCDDLGWGVDELKALLEFLAYYRPYNEMIPAAIYRLDRCAPGDVEVLEGLLGQIEWPGPEHGFSVALYFNTVYSEAWDHSLFEDSAAILDYLEGIWSSSLLAGSNRQFFYDLSSHWPVYMDRFNDRWPITNVPLLILQGMIDPATAYEYAETLADRYTGEHQHFVAFPYASHGVIHGSPMSFEPDAEDCGWNLFFAFLRDPTAPLDTSCVDHTVPLDFEGKNNAGFFMGRDDFFEN